MITFTVANRKGGVGKSTSAAMLATEFALKGYRTLLIDADPQANATSFFMPPENVRVGLDLVLLKRVSPDTKQASITDVAAQTQIPQLKLIPPGIELAYYERENYVNIAGLRKALAEVDTGFDYCFIDTPPTLSLLLSTALVACNYVLIPCQTEPMSMKGVRDLMGVVVDARDINPQLQIAGVFITMHNRRTNLARAIEHTLHNKFNEHTFETVINRQIKLTECSTQHQPIQLYAPESTGAADYRALASELLAYTNFMRSDQPRETRFAVESLDEQQLQKATV